MIALPAVRRALLFSLALAACHATPAPVAAPAVAASSRGGTAPQLQMRAVAGGAVVNVPLVALADVRLLVPAVESHAACHVIEGPPIPGVARMLTLSFDSTAVGGRNMSLGLATDGTPVSYSEARGDVTRRAGDFDRPRTKMTSISIAIPQRRATIFNTEQGVEQRMRVQDSTIMTAPVLGDPSANIARIQRACANVTPQSAILAPGSAPIPSAALVGPDRAAAVRRLSSDPEAFVPTFAAVNVGGVCVSVPAAAARPVAQLLVKRFMVRGIPVRELSLALDASGRPITYQDLRSGNLNAPGGPTASTHTSIVLDFVRRTATLANVTADQQREEARAPLEAALDAKRLDVPAALMDGLREQCGGKQ